MNLKTAVLVSSSLKSWTTCKIYSQIREKSDEGIDKLLKENGYDLEALSDSSSV
jgi:hypothetical protein